MKFIELNTTKTDLKCWVSVQHIRFIACRDTGPTYVEIGTDDQLMVIESPAGIIAKINMEGAEE